MKGKITILALLGLTVSLVASANVTVNTGPESLVPDPILAPANSAPIGLFSVTLSQDAGESLTSLAVTIDNDGSSTATASEFASVSVYKDDGDGLFDSSTDLPAGSEATVNIGSATVVATGSNNSIDGGKFFVALSTSGTWSSSAPADSVTATFGTDGVVTSDNSPAVTEATTAAITADTSGPLLESATAVNSGGTLIKGSDATVWFVTKNKKRRGFTSASNFLGLGFRFDQVMQISDDDLGEIDTDQPIDNASLHPDGSLIKCGNSPTVFQVIGNAKFPFANGAAFTGRGHSWDSINEVDCGRFRYLEGSPIEED